jgi:TolA-binding protein
LARLTRQELKKDEFGAQLGAGLDYFMHHKRPLLKWIGIVAGVVVVVFAVLLFVRHRNAAAADAFGTALDTYHAQVTAEPPKDSTAKTFKTDKERLEASISEFNKVAEEHGGTGSAKWAKYYVALANIELEKYADAEKELQSLANEGNADLSSSAKLALAGAYEKQNKRTEAEKLLKEIIEKPSNTVPKATAQLTLADMYRSSNPAQARALYQELAKDFPDTTIAELADMRIGELPAK